MNTHMMPDGTMMKNSMMRQKKRPLRRKLPNPDAHSMHAQHHQVRAMNEHRQMPSYKKIMKEYQDQVASINFRNDMIQRQRNANYQNEYDRLTGALDRTILPGWNLTRLQERKNNLKKLLHENILHGWGGWG